MSWAWRPQAGPQKALVECPLKFTDHVKVDAVYGISEEPMSAEEWKKQFVKAG
jgi:hypothetical protein